MDGMTKLTRVEHLPNQDRPEGYKINDPRLHQIMVHSSSRRYNREHPVHPYPQASSYIADLIQGDHDLTLMDANRVEARHGGPFYDHAHYLASLAACIDAMNTVGDIEHTGDWDWYLGMVLRDGTKIGDGSFIDFEDDPDYEKAHAHGYCDTFRVPTFSETRPEEISYEDWYTNMPVVLDLWNETTPNGITVAVKDIATVHFNER